MLLLAFSARWAAADNTDSISLWEAHDPGLQRVLDDTVTALGLTSAARKGQLAVTLVDISRLDEPRVADVNGNQMIYAASLPKIGILLAACADIEDGRLALTDDLQASMVAMIRTSSNDAATAVMNTVGNRRVNEILRSNRFRLYDPAVNGGLWVGKEYARGVAFERDPLHNISHGATAMQTARFYYLLESGTLLGPAMTRLMRTALSEPAIQHKFVKGLAGQRVRMYRKSGTWNEWHSDSALIEGVGFKYILVGLTQNPQGSLWLEQLSRRLHQSMAPQRVAFKTP